MILVTFAVAAIAWGALGTAITGALSVERNLAADPIVLFHMCLMGAGMIGLAYLTA